MNVTRLMAAAALAAALSMPAFAQAPELQAQAPSETPAAPPAAPAAAGRVTPSGDIIATLTASGQFTTLLKALDATNLTSVLKGKGPLTVFAPTDAAFAALPPGQLASLMGASPPADLQKLLIYHIINAKVDDSKIKGAKGPIPTVATTPVYIDGSGAPKVNDADIVQTDVVVTNGVVYPIDKVLSPTFTPPPAAKAEAAPEEPASKPAAKAVTRKRK
jgi:uncharacterized surface protein with fasciclin (FAS1) repeats